MSLQQEAIPMIYISYYLLAYMFLIKWFQYNQDLQITMLAKIW